jgi:succinyl-CoA synthetase beta subunit
VVTSGSAARAAARELGFPLVAKAASAHAVHKAAAGLVRLGIRTEEAAERSFERIRANAQATGLDDGADGVLFEEERAGGAEVFLGARRDPTFGLLIGVGVGGANVERKSAVRWELAPLDAHRVASLVEGVRSWGLLDGPGGCPRDAEALRRAIHDFYDAVRRLGERLVEAEINPLAVFAEGEGACALDAVLELGPTRSREWSKIRMAEDPAARAE